MRPRCERLEERRLLSAPGADWRLAWSDEFTGAKLNASKWSTALPWTGKDGSSGDFNETYLNYFTGSDVSVSDGQVHLLSQAQTVTDSAGKTFNYTSGMISTVGKFSMLYGYVEISAQVPINAGPGVWPAFWMLSYGWPPEDDVAEFQTSANHFHQGLAYQSSSGAKWDDMNSYTPLLSGFHTYGMEWEPGYQIFTVDGQITHVTRGNYVPNVPMYLILNSGVQASSPPDSTTAFPNSFDVDYVRVYQRDSLPYIENPGFEGGSLGLWQGAYNSWVVQSDANSGTDALQLEGNGSSASQVISRLQPNTTYVLMAFAEVSDPTNEATIGVENTGGAVASASTQSTSYTPLSVTFTTGRKSTSATIYGLQSAGAGFAWLDDFSLHAAAAIENPGLETGTLAAWSAVASASLATSGVHSGKYALLETGPSAETDQTIYGLAPNTSYNLTVWAKISSAADQATVGLIDESGAETESQVVSKQYKKITISFTTGAASTSAELFCSKAAGDGLAWFDDFKLTVAAARS